MAKTLCGLDISELVPGFSRNGNIRDSWEWSPYFRGVTCKLCLRRRPTRKKEDK
jgi:hypothetical protein